MIYPTYTHPGINTAMLALSRAMRLEVIAKRAMRYWQELDPDLCRICTRQMIAARLMQAIAAQRIIQINKRHSA